MLCRRAFLHATTPSFALPASSAPHLSISNAHGIHPSRFSLSSVRVINRSDRLSCRDLYRYDLFFRCGGDSSDITADITMPVRSASLPFTAGFSLPGPLRTDAKVALSPAQNSFRRHS